MLTRAELGRLHGVFNVVGGLWPLLHMASFERVFGGKVDRWLVQTVAGLLVGNGLVQLGAAGSPEGDVHARRLGMATAATLLSIDLRYASSGRISRMYLADAALEAALLAAWSTAPARRRRR